eukprot:tig00001339_g8264.t1
MQAETGPALQQQAWQQPPQDAYYGQEDLPLPGTYQMDPYFDSFRRRAHRAPVYPPGADPRTPDERIRDVTTELAAQLKIQSNPKHVDAAVKLREKALENGSVKFSIFSRTSHTPVLCVRVTKEGAKAAGVCMSLRPHIKPEVLNQIEKFKAALHQHISMTGGGVEIDVAQGFSRLLLQFNREPVEKLFQLHGAPKALAAASQKFSKFRFTHFTSLIIDYHRNALEVGFVLPQEGRGRRGEYFKALVMDSRLIVPDNQLLTLLRGASYATMTFGFDASAGPERICFFRAGARAADIHALNSDPLLRAVLTDAPAELASGRRWRAGYSFGRGDLYVRMDVDFECPPDDAAAGAALRGETADGFVSSLAARLGASGAAAAAAASTDSLIDRIAAVFKGPPPRSRPPPPPRHPPRRAARHPRAAREVPAGARSRRGRVRRAGALRGAPGGEPSSRPASNRAGQGALEQAAPPQEHVHGYPVYNWDPQQRKGQPAGGPAGGFREQYAREQARARAHGDDCLAHDEPPYAGLAADPAKMPPSAPPPGAPRYEGRRPQDSVVYQVWRNEEKAPSAGSSPQQPAKEKKKKRW